MPTDEEINIAIAEWMGCRRYERPFDKRVFLCAENPASWPTTDREVDRINSDVPNHITGPEALGNMHEAEKRLDSWQRDLMADHLVNDIQPGRIDDYDPRKHGDPHLAWHGLFKVLHATARQRAIALLKVVRPELFTK